MNMIKVRLTRHVIAGHAFLLRRRLQMFYRADNAVITEKIIPRRTL